MILRNFELRNSGSFCRKAEKFIEVKKEKKSQVCKAPGFPSGSDSKESACHAGELCWEDHPEKGMATYSSIVAWRIPWTEEPGALQFMGSQRVGQNWSAKTQKSPEILLYILKC